MWLPRRVRMARKTSTKKMLRSGEARKPTEMRISTAMTGTSTLPGSVTAGEGGQTAAAPERPSACVGGVSLTCPRADSARGAVVASAPSRGQEKFAL